MPYVTTAERIGMKKGMEQGIQVGSHTQAIKTALLLLTLQVGALDEATQSHICALPLEQLEAVSAASLKFKSLADLTAWLQQHPPLAAAPAPADSLVN